MCFKKSEILDESEVVGWLALIQYSESIINKSKKLNSYEKKTIEHELLKYWNENLNIEVENFWKLIAENKLPFTRSSTFENIISRQRFKNVEQAIDIYNDIFSRPIVNSKNKELKERLDKLYIVVQIDRDKRIKQIRKWIRNERVSFSDGLKFGENYAYLKRTGLFEEIINQKDQTILEKLAKR